MSKQLKTISIEVDAKMDDYLLREGIRQEMEDKGFSKDMIVVPAGDSKVCDLDVESEAEAIALYIQKGLLRVIKLSMSSNEHEKLKLN